MPVSSRFCHDAPDKFLLNAEKINSTLKPVNLTTGSVYDELSKDIFAKYEANKQSDETFRNKILVWKRLNEKLKTDFPNYGPGLHVTGSTINGYGTKDGDVDMSLIEKDLSKPDRMTAIRELSRYYKSFQKDQNLDRLELIRPTTPLILCHDKVCDVEINIGYQNSINLRNTHLLFYYSKVDWRVKPLVCIIKMWAKFHGINEARYQTISSYSLVLMIIHFLQYGSKPAVLPNLQSLFVNKFGPSNDIENLDYFENLQLPAGMSKNSQSLGELFIDFLKYYTEFNYENEVISIRQAKVISFAEIKKGKSYISEPYRWKFLKIEEPYTLENTARSVHEYTAFQKIKKVFSTSYKKVNASRELSSVFEKVL